jgi:alpha-beta hydrolase superfamily lysophospholipase
VTRRPGGAGDAPATGASTAPPDTDPPRGSALDTDPPGEYDTDTELPGEREAEPGLSATGQPAQGVVRAGPSAAPPGTVPPAASDQPGPDRPVTRGAAGRPDPGARTGLPAAGLSDWLAAREAAVPGLRPGAEKRLLWHGAPETVSDWAVVYLHGFSASAQETQPLPQRVAAGLGATLYLARLTGHGRDGPAMAEASLAAWRADTLEALEIGARTGRRVLLMGCSTGATLAALALGSAAAQQVAGAVLLAPNFAPRDRRAGLLAWPGVGRLLPHLIGAERGFTPQNAAHAQGWTTRYPVSALIPMAQAVRAARRLPKPGVPVLMLYDPRDRVVDHRQTRRIARRWGATARAVTLGPGDDPARHVIAGDILSPGMTETVAAQVLDWARRL